MYEEFSREEINYAEKTIYEHIYRDYNIKGRLGSGQDSDELPKDLRGTVFYQAIFKTGFWNECNLTDASGNGTIFLGNDFYKALLNSPFKDEIGAYYGETIIKEAEYSQKSFSKEVIEDMQLENKLGSQYQKLIASAKIEFDGEERTLAQLVPFVTSEDREVRKRASEAKYNFFVKHEGEIDDIFDKLVKVRTKIAKKLGFNNFVELGYVRMRRYDYNKKMVENFRKQVEEFIVPIDSKLYERQAKRLGLETLKYYDEKLGLKMGEIEAKGYMI